MRSISQHSGFKAHDDAVLTLSGIMDTVPKFMHTNLKNSADNQVFFSLFFGMDSTIIMKY